MMNNAYEETPPNPHVHWHFMPRYKEPVKIGNHNFIDHFYDQHYDRNKREIIEKLLFQEVLQKIKTEL